MAKLDRLILSRGPAIITYRGATFLSQDDISFDAALQFGDINSSAFGIVDRFKKPFKPTLTLNLVGEVRSLTVSHPYGTTSNGASILGTADSTLIIQPIDTTQQQTTFQSAALTKISDLDFSSQQVLLNGIEFALLGANNVDALSTTRFMVQATNTLTNTGFTPATVLVQPYLGSWLSVGTANTFTLSYGTSTTGPLFYNATAAVVGSAISALATIVTAGGATTTGDAVNGYTVTFTSNGVRTGISGTLSGSIPNGMSLKQEIRTTGSAGTAQIVLLKFWPWGGFTTADGFHVAFGLNTTDITNDALGIVDILFSSLTVTVTAIAQGVTDTDVFNAISLQGATSALGTKISTLGNDLYISGTGCYFKVYGAGLTGAKLAYSATKDRCQQLTWTATRTISGVTANPLYAFDVNPIA